MKKKVLISLLLFFMGMSGVCAKEFSVGSLYDKSFSEEYFVNGLKYYDGTANATYDFSMWSYKMVAKSDSSETISYCLDPQKKDGNNYKIDRILGDEGSSKSVQAYDAGIQKILEHGLNDFNSSYKGLSGSNLYVATSIAIRAFTLGLYDWGGGAETYLFKSSAHATLGAQWAAEFSQYSTIAVPSCAGSSNIQNCFLNNVKSTYSWYDSKSTFKMDSSTASSVIEAAKSLFGEGVQAAAEFMQNGSAAGNVSYEIGKEVQVERQEDTVKSYILITLNVENFAEEGVINNFKVDPSSNGKGITIDSIEYSLDNENFSTLSSGVNVASDIPVENGVRNGKVYIKLNITKVVNDDCENMRFKVTFDYNDPNKLIQAAILKEVNSPDKQRFLVITKLGEGDVLNQVIEGNIGCAQEICETKISVPECSEDENDAIAEIIAPEEIKKCILNNVDDATNSYQLTESNGGVSNNYCSIFCKEDYKDVIDNGVDGGIKLNPIVEDVVCGGYFQLKSHVEGQKDCYTGGNTDDDATNGKGSIDKDKYLEEIINAQKKMIENRDLYLMASNVLNNILTGYGDCGCYYYYVNPYATYSGLNAVVVDEENGIVEARETSKSFDEKYSSYCEGNCVAAADGTCDSSCKPGDKSDITKLVENDLEIYKEGMEEAYEDYVEIITSYNACTAAWTNEFLFGHSLTYYFDELQSDGTLHSDYYNMKSPDDFTLEAIGEAEEESEVEICLSTTNDKYECDDTPVTFDELNETVINEDGAYNVVEEYKSKVYEEFTFTICDVDGCEDSNQLISQAAFIRKSVKKSQDYITPTVYYQTDVAGFVTVNEGFDNDAASAFPIFNGVPVSRKAVGGGNFKLMIQDLGEFYDSGELGRLIDFEGDHEDESVANALGDAGIETFDGNYECQFYSPCRPEDCPDCDITCEPDGCEWDPGACPDCVFDCINCVVDLGKLQVNFKPISTTTVNSADREYGYNWMVDTSLLAPDLKEQLSLITLKAETTIDEIEESNETIFKTDGDNSELAFSIRMTPEVIAHLKDYNKSATSSGLSVEESGGYANDSLTCYDANLGGTAYNKIYCYSEVIDDLVARFDDQIIVKNRTDASARSNNNANASGYWTLWPNWSESEKDENGQYTVIGGPAWK